MLDLLYIMSATLDFCSTNSTPYAIWGIVFICSLRLYSLPGGSSVFRARDFLLPKRNRNHWDEIVVAAFMHNLVEIASCQETCRALRVFYGTTEMRLSFEISVMLTFTWRPWPWSSAALWCWTNNIMLPPGLLLEEKSYLKPSFWSRAHCYRAKLCRYVRLHTLFNAVAVLDITGGEADGFFLLCNYYVIIM